MSPLAHDTRAVLITISVSILYKMYVYTCIMIHYKYTLIAQNTLFNFHYTAYMN